MNIEELKRDLDEVQSFLNLAQRQRIKDALSAIEDKIKIDITKCMVEHQKTEVSSTEHKKGIAPAEQKRYLVELTEYAWDQSDKFVKIFVTLDGVQNLLESDITTFFTEKSMKLTVRNVNNKDYSLSIMNLLSPINVENSYHKIKTDMVAIYMRKQKANDNWSHLTSTEKRVKDLKDSSLQMDDNDELKDDPTAGIMNLMKKMYQSGDSDMKRMIAKAWTESQEKKNENLEF